MGKKISEMTPAASLGATDIIPVVSGGTNKYVTGAQVKAFTNYNNSYNAIIDQAAVSVHDNTPTNIYNFTLDAGIWLLQVVARFNSSTAGRRHLALYNAADSSSFYGSVYFTESDSAASGTEIVTLQVFTVVNIPNDNSPVYVRVTQTNTTNADVDVTPRVQFIKLADN